RRLVVATPPAPAATLFPYTTLFRSPQPGRSLPPQRRVELVHHAPGSPPKRSRLPLRSRSPALPARGWPTTARRPPHLSPHARARSEEHTSELQSREQLVCRLLLEKK